MRRVEGWATLGGTMDWPCQLPGEDDEAFLLRAEHVMQLETSLAREHVRDLSAKIRESLVQGSATSVVTAALDAFDKPSDTRPAKEILRSLLVDELDELHQEQADDNRRVVLMARATLRAQLEVASGTDVNARNAYALLSQLAIELFRDGRGRPLP
jgi:hypothetical protein